MSKRTSAIRGSRRVFVCGLFAVFSAAPRALASGKPIHEVERAFIAWLGAVAVYNRQQEDWRDEAGPDPLWQRIEELERSFYTMEPSAMAIGALTLMQMSYDSPSDVPPVNAGFVDLYDHNRERLRVLEYVRPHLSGLIGQIAADVLDNPGRPFGESMIWQLRSNGAPA